MNVDLHTHTYPASDCSHISFRDYIAWCVEHGVEAVALTNHGDVSDNRKLEPALAAEGVLLVDAVEVYNGSWLDERYVTTAEQIAAQLGAARTGGSDAHEAGQLMACYTELPDPLRSTADVVTALKERRTIPHRPEALRKRRFGLF